MVNFTNITFDEEWVYANAYCIDYNISGKIKINRKTGEYVSDFNDINSLVHKAALYIRMDINNGKLKQNSKRTIAWG